MHMAAIKSSLFEEHLCEKINVVFIPRLKSPAFVLGIFVPHFEAKKEFFSQPLFCRHEIQRSQVLCLAVNVVLVQFKS